MKTTFKKGDKVFDIRFGWGVVIFMYSFDWEKEEDSKLVCVVKFENEEEVHYTKQIALKLLSFTEYTLKGLSQKTTTDWSKYFHTWGIFYDEKEDFESTNRIGRLYDYDNDSIYHFQSYEGKSYMNFKPLIDEQIKVLNLEQ